MEKIDRCTIHHGDCLDVLAEMEPDSLDACVTDPPYHLTSVVKRYGGHNAAPTVDGVYGRSTRGFMGKQWDGGDVAFRPETWAEVYRVLKPGAHLLAFSGTRTYHRMACAIEDAGFEIRDQIFWAYGSGFPKSHDVSKGIDKAAGAERGKVRFKPRAHSSGTMSGSCDSRPWIERSRETGFHEAADNEPITEAARQWQGWGTALKPALEPICVARKPLIGTVASNVLEHGTGALNIDGCRVGTEAPSPRNAPKKIIRGGNFHAAANTEKEMSYYNPTQGRWPANLCHDGSEEVLACFPDGAERYYYCPKASKADRLGSKHPTVKPVNLMRWLVRLVTPPGGTVLDPFAGSGTTGMACMAEGFDAVLIEREAESVEDIKRRIRHVVGSDGSMFTEETIQEPLL